MAWTLFTIIFGYLVAWLCFWAAKQNRLKNEPTWRKINLFFAWLNVSLATFNLILLNMRFYQ